MRARVMVMPKADVLDPQGKAVGSALHSLGYGEVASVRIGKLIELDLGDVGRPQAEAQVREMCERLLANTVIEDFRFELSE